MAVIVKKKPGQSDQKLISDFRRQVRRAGVKEKAEESSRYIKPSQQRRREEKEQERKAKRRGR